MRGDYRVKDTAATFPLLGASVIIWFGQVMYMEQY